MFLAIEVQPRHQDEPLALLLFIDSVGIAIPSGCQGFGAPGVEKLLQNFLPAEFAHDVFIKL
jgi:hypothetical protein